MNVYKQEIDDGLQEIIAANASIAYCVEAKPLNVLDEKMKDSIYSSFAEVRKQNDLFFLDTILVTVGCNKNKDIFDKKEVRAARKTPENKPFNLGHNQTNIIGHITANFAVGTDYKLIPDSSSIDELPDKYHILTSAVIYRFWEDDNRRKAVAQIIDEICAANKWYVSMECVFSNFDYGLIAKSGEQRVIARTEESAFLTKHLAQYGGSGKYQDFTLGRVLRNITFSGKGLVENPANPESDIILDTLSFKSTFANLGYITSMSGSTDITGDNKMSLDLERENKDLKATVADLQKQLSDKTSKSIDELTNKLEAAVKEADEEKKKKSAKETEWKVEAEKLEAQLKAAKEEKDKEKKAKEEAEDEVKAARAEAEKMKEDKKKTDRMSKLKESGADAATATKFLEKYAELPDTAFADMVEYASVKWKNTNTTATASEVMETASVTKEETVSFPTEGSNLDSVTASIHEYVKAALKRKES